MPPPPWFVARLVAARALAPSVRELAFEREDGPLPFAPGQWVNVEVPTAAGPIVRAYSIASAPDGSSRYELAVTRVAGGPVSNALHSLAPGATVRTQAAQGFFTRATDAGHPTLFVATGTGVTPLRSMLHAALAAGAREPMTVLLGVRHEEDLLYRSELEALASARSNVRVELTLSQGDEGWTGRRGYVQTHVPELLGALGDEAHVYVCGLERMVTAVRDVARKNLGLPRQRVHSERYD